MAGGKLGEDNASFYLKTGAPYWSLSPYNFYRTGYAGEFSVYSAGALGTGYVDITFGLRPVVSLKLGTSILSGSGTSSSPYIIK